MLTVTALKRLKPKERDYKVSDRDSMYAVVKPSGVIIFRYDYRLNGRRETLTIGRFGADGTTLAAAREQCLGARRSVAEGKSPAQEKQRKKRRLKEAKNFGDFGARWITNASMADSTRNMRRIIYDRDIFPVWKNRLLSEITPDDLRALCGKVRDRGAPATAIHIRDIVKQIFGFAILHGEKVANPADEVAKASIATFVPKDRALSRQEIRLMFELLERVSTQPAISIDPDGDDNGDRDDASGLAHLHVGCVDPQIRPVALDWPIEEGLYANIDLLAQAAHLALRDAAHAHGLDQIVDRAGRDALDVGLLDHRGQGLLGHPPRLEEAREVAALAQLGDTQLDRASSRLPVAVAVAVTLHQPVRALRAMGRPRQCPHFQFHQPLGGKADHVAQNIGVGGLLHERAQVHHLIGHRWCLRFQVGVSNPTLTRKSPVTAARPLPRYSAPHGRARSQPCSSYTTIRGTTSHPRTRTIRPRALTRKNALFADSDGGAEHWAVIAALIEICKLIGVEPSTTWPTSHPHRRWSSQ